MSCCPHLWDLIKRGEAKGSRTASTCHPNQPDVPSRCPAQGFVEGWGGRVGFLLMGLLTSEAHYFLLVGSTALSCLVK